MFHLWSCNMIFKNYVLLLLILFSKSYYTNGVCKSLTSTLSTTITCKYNNQTLENCTNPADGTEASLSCNEFYEEPGLERNLIRICRNGRWDGFIPQCYPVCGKKRHIGKTIGHDVQDILLNNPWNVGIYNEEKKLICGGTLINTDTVLTAARCVFHTHDYLVVGAGKYYSNYNDSRDKLAQYSKILKIEISEKYRTVANSHESDLAIVILTIPFLLSLVVQPICINTDIMSDNMLHDSLSNISTVSGYVCEDQVSDELKETTVVLVPHQICLTAVERQLILYDKICLSSTSNAINVCYFYNGCGLIAKNISDERYYIQGLLSQPWEPQKEICKTMLYNLFTSTTKHINFLRNHISKNNKNCRLPNITLDGEYNLSGSNKSYDPDTDVPPQSTLFLSCHSGYSVLGANQSRCLDNGDWTSAIGTCHRNSTIPNYIYVIIAIIIFVVAVASILFKVKYKKKRQIRRELKLSGLYYFSKGKLKKFNPKLGIEDQAELLPYNYNFEFPSDKLELGKEVGSGTFGIVLKANAFGIIPNEENTTVAVKTVKKTAGHIAMKTLISELKILVHLGQHLNVVNLLGACTKDIRNRELLVIVEYCRFGNLYNYLLTNRDNYIDQIDSATGNIDYSYGCENVEFKLVAVNNIKNSESDEMSIKSIGESISSAEDEQDTNNIQSQSKSNICDDVKPIRTQDLISWAFQVARGMEYLACRKIVHGDLAARNILLADNNIVKICDFGLSKMLCKRDEYKNQSDSPVPLKWMAIESIQDGIFSTRSDVWSYGIMLWELFSLSQIPYPGIEDDNQLCKKLVNGYRMESPEFAPKDMYKIMCDCWDNNPLSRPSFNQLAGTVGLMLEENIRQHYIDLNDPYFVMNTQKLIESEKDYLDQLSSAEYRCINKVNFTTRDIFGYLFVKPSQENLAIAEDTPNEEDAHSNT